MDVNVFDSPIEIDSKIAEVTTKTMPAFEEFDFSSVIPEMKEIPMPEITKVEIPEEEEHSTLFMTLDKEDGVLNFLNIPNIPNVHDFMEGLFWAKNINNDGENVWDLYIYLISEYSKKKWTDHVKSPYNPVQHK